MLIPFPDDDEPRQAVAGFLRAAQRLLGGDKIDSAMLQVRKASETIKNISSWNWPGDPACCRGLPPFRRDAVNSECVLAYRETGG